MKVKTYEEINQKISSGEVVVLTAEELTELSKSKSPEEIWEEVDVVTTATFGPMCSSGVFINFGHTNPPIRMEKATLNGVPIFTGIAAVDSYIGATEVHPENEKYGGAHVICDLISGKDLELKAEGKGTDCYPKKKIHTTINKDSVNEIFMFNPRNAYQNYGAATNSTKNHKYTYMGSLLPGYGNLTYSTSGELSPLLNDPDFKTIGVGTKIFLGGAEGYVAWNGTQFNTTKPKNEHGIPTSNAATLAVIGDVKAMNEEHIKAAYYERYGVSIFIGLGIPIPVLTPEIVNSLSISNKQIETTICDYGKESKPALGKVTYEELQSGEVELNGKKIKTAPLSSLSKARKIAEELKSKIKAGKFTLTKPVKLFPENTTLNSLQENN